MYNDLVKNLRDKAEFLDRTSYARNVNNDFADAMNQAADAIEELSAYVRQIEELRKDGYYLQKTKMMTYGQATMTMPLPEPPKEET